VVVEFDKKRKFLYRKHDLRSMIIMKNISIEAREEYK